MLAGLGSAVFAVDLFGAGVRPTTIEVKKQATSVLYNDRQRMPSQLLRGRESTGGGNAANGVAMGYCFGGLRFGAGPGRCRSQGFVSLHGGLETLDGQDYQAVKGDNLIFHGTADRSVSMEEFAALAETLEQRGLPHEMITDGWAPQAFSVLFSTDRYRIDADTKSWKRFAEFLNQILR